MNGYIYGGNWDLTLREIDNYIFIKSYKERYQSGKEWYETELYKEVLKKIETGKIVQSCSNKMEWHSHLSKVDRIYKEIKLVGYKTQTELKTKRPWDEIRVAIGRDRQIIFLDGRNRLALAKALNLEKIPVYICAIHPESYTENPNDFIEEIRVN